VFLHHTRAWVFTLFAPAIGSHERNGVNMGEEAQTTDLQDGMWAQHLKKCVDVLFVGCLLGA